MMINFRKIFEFFFKSFDVAGDTKLIEKLELDWNRFLMVIKRHWIYSILNSWRVILVIIIALGNIYLLTYANKNIDSISIIIAIFLFLNVAYWVFIISLYIYRFYKIQWSKPYIEDIYSSIKKSKQSDIAFSNFFNQTIFLFIVLFLITIFTIITWILSLFKWWTGDFWVWILNSFLTIMQFWLFYGFLTKMINQEMDFKIVVPWKILFYNQLWVLLDSKSMNSNKIKTMNTKYRWLLGSFFNYGDIIILSEWDHENNWEMKMDYIWDPTKTVKEIEKVLKKDFDTIEKDVNFLLKKFNNEIWIDNINTPENIEKLKKYVLDNEKKLKEIFDSWDDEIKKEIRELYIIINK